MKLHCTGAQARPESVQIKIAMFNDDNRDRKTSQKKTNENIYVRKLM